MIRPGSSTQERCHHWGGEVGSGEGPVYLHPPPNCSFPDWHQWQPHTGNEIWGEGEEDIFAAEAGCNQFFYVSVCPQERQRLETILNLCAEYNKGDGPFGGEAEGRMGFPGGLGPGEGAARRPSMDSLAGSSSLRRSMAQRQQRESDEENLKEECSSTESTHQEVRTPLSPQALHNGDKYQVRRRAVYYHFHNF